MRFSGGYCDRHERNGNVCGIAKQQKANSAGTIIASSPLSLQNDLYRIGPPSYRPPEGDPSRKYPKIRIFCNMCDSEVRSVQCVPDILDDTVIDGAIVALRLSRNP